MTYTSSPNLSEWEKQIIMGTVLGGSSVVKPAGGRNCYIFMRNRNEDWMLFKVNQLHKLATNNTMTKENNSFRWHSNCYPIFCEYRELFYRQGKKTVNMDILNMLTRYGLMTWYGDCGHIIRNRAILNTHKFGEDGTNVISQFFNEVNYNNHVIKERGYLRVAFTRDSTIQYFRTFAEISPFCLYERLLLN